MKFSLVSPFLLYLTTAAGLVQAQTALNYTGNYPGTYGLSITKTIYQAGTDATSSNFLKNQVPVFHQFINENLQESKALSDISAVSLNPEKISLATASKVRVYFIAEGAGYHNTLGVTTIGPQGTKSSQLVFPDGSSINSNYLSGDTSASRSLRTSNFPLLPGDFVDLGTVAAGSQLDFFLIADGASGGTYKYTSTADSNPDRKQHMVMFAVPGSPYILVGFEDLYGLGDRDFNDMMFVVDIGGVSNVDALLSNPEPGTILLFSCVGLLLYTLERKKTRRPAIA